MADRILNWYIEEVLGDGTNQGPSFYLENNYSLPAEVRVYAGKSPDSTDLQIDIKDDGVSLFTNLPTLQKGANGLDWWEDFNDDLTLMAKYSLITLDITQSGGAKKITVQLELNKEHEEKDEERYE